MNAAEYNRTVLLVEDSDDDAFFFERAFDDAAAPDRLVRVQDGEAAVDFLERASKASRDLLHTHIVFLDLKIPRLRGIDVLRFIKETGLSIKVLVLSGSDMETDIEMARSLGALDYVVKPISAAQIKKYLAQEEIGDGAK